MSEAAGHAGQAQGPGGEGAGETAHQKSPNYYLIWLYLFILTAAEVGLAFLGSFPKSVIVSGLVGLAIWKALLVALYYMHLRFEPKRLRLVAIAPLPAAVIMIVAIMMEYV